MTSISCSISEWTVGRDDFTRSDSALPAHTRRAEDVSPAAKEINDHDQEEEKTVDEHRWELDPASSHV
jgi:hypothetical protein